MAPAFSTNRLSRLDLEAIVFPIESVVVKRRKELSPDSRKHYSAFCDISGGRVDDATLAFVRHGVMKDGSDNSMIPPVINWAVAAAEDTVTKTDKRDYLWDDRVALNVAGKKRQEPWLYLSVEHRNDVWILEQTYIVEDHQEANAYGIVEKQEKIYALIVLSFELGVHLQESNIVLNKLPFNYAFASREHPIKLIPFLTNGRLVQTTLAQNIIQSIDHPLHHISWGHALRQNLQSERNPRCRIARMISQQIGSIGCDPVST